MSADFRKMLKKLKKVLQRLCGDSLDHMVLYGSQAGGDARPDSDVDILLVSTSHF